MPDDPRPPYITSGLRIGTPAITTQGMGKREMREIAYEIHEVLTHRDDEAALAEIRGPTSAPGPQVRPVPAGRVTTSSARHRGRAGLEHLGRAMMDTR